MKAKAVAILIVVAQLIRWQSEAQTYDTNNVMVQTFVGSGFTGYVDGEGTQTMFNNPGLIVGDALSNLFVLDKANLRLRKITPDGTVSTFAGGGNQISGTGTNASIDTGNIYSDMTIDHSNNVWITTANGFLIRVGSDAYVSRIALTGIVWPWGVTVDSTNNLYISDYTGRKIYRYKTNGVLEVFAGSGNSGSVNGNGIFTSFSFPAALAVDSADNIYVWDSGNHLVRRINQNRDVTTIAGKGNYGDDDEQGLAAGFDSIFAMTGDGNGNIIMACGSSVRRMSASTNVTTVAGVYSGFFPSEVYANGSGVAARFNGASGVCVSQGRIFIADAGNQRVRQISFNPSEQIVTGPNLGLNTYPGVKITGIVGRTYRIESSLDANVWSTQTTLLLNSSPYLWIDQNPLGQKKFYRAYLLP